MRTILALAFLFGLHDVLAETSTSQPTIGENRKPVQQQYKQLWAQSYLYAKAPDLVVEKWLTSEPDTKGKFLLIAFWSTWCSACRATQPLMNVLQKAYGDELVIMGISDEPEEKVLSYMQQQGIEYSMAIDQQDRMKDRLGIWGIPHVIIVEPGGYVIWEGYPLLEGHALTELTIQKILTIGRPTIQRKPAS